MQMNSAAKHFNSNNFTNNTYAIFDIKQIAVVDTTSEYSEIPPSPTTPPYQKLTKSLQTDPKCAQEVALGRRVGLYKFCGDIGRGNFSKVKLAYNQLTRDKVAIKVVDRSGLDARALRMLSREVATLECVHHPNILRLFEVVETLGRVYLITEWIRGGELYNHITQGGPLREVHAAPLYKQLLLAVKHMHSLGFVHRDIKAENVLLVSEDRLKLADFGFSTELVNGPQQKLDTFCGSPPYAAPELFSDDHYFGGPVDVWALGVLLYFMVVGNMPFRAPTVPALRATVLKGDYTVPGHLTLPCIRLIQRILVHLPVRRPTIDDMLASQWVTYPNLSTELMTLEINHRTAKNTKKKSSSSTLWFRTKKTRNIPKNYSIRERYIELTNKLPIALNTRKNDGIMNDNFLHPIDLSTKTNISSNIDQNHHQQSSLINQQQQQQQLQRRSFLSGTLKKKVGPMENDKEKNYKNGEIRFIDETTNISPLHKLENNFIDVHNTTTSTVAKTTSISSLTQKNNYDEENGKFIMLPTDTDDLEKLNPLEIEGREILEKLGVTSTMLRDAIKNGPRSDIIGAYRIIINRLQKQAWIAKRQNEILINEQSQHQQQIHNKASKRNRIGCTIL